MRPAILLACLVGCGAAQRAQPTTGAITGLASDRASGDPIARAEIRVRADGAPSELVTASSDRGHYDAGPLRPGRYQLSASFAGQPMEIVNIPVRAGEITQVDLTFTLGVPDRIRIDHSAATQSNQKRAPIDASSQNPALSR